MSSRSLERYGNGNGALEPSLLAHTPLARITHGREAINPFLKKNGLDVLRQLGYKPPKLQQINDVFTLLDQPRQQVNDMWEFYYPQSEPALDLPFARLSSPGTGIVIMETFLKKTAPSDSRLLMIGRHVYDDENLLRMVLKETELPHQWNTHSGNLIARMLRHNRFLPDAYLKKDDPNIEVGVVLPNGLETQAQKYIEVDRNVEYALLGRVRL